MGSSARWSRPIVFVAGNEWYGVGSSDRHLAQRLAQCQPVIYVEPPTTGQLPGCTADIPHRGVLRLRITVPPGMYRPGLHRLLPTMVASFVNSTLVEQRTEASVVIAASPLPVLRSIRGNLKVLYASDDWVAGAELMGLPQQRMRKVQSAQTQSAHLVIAVSETLGRQYRALGHPNVVVVPNGCDVATLANVDKVPVASDVRLPCPVAGLLGHLSDRVSLAHLEAVAERPLSLLLVGPRHNNFGGHRFDELVRRPNVCWVGQRPYTDIPSYLQLMDVGLTPYANSAFNQASSPLKTIEYLAAGRASVATDLPGIRAFGTDQVTIADSSEAFAAAVERMAGIPRTRLVVSRRHSAAMRHDWDLRTADVLSALGSIVGAETRRSA